LGGGWRNVGFRRDMTRPGAFPTLRGGWQPGNPPADGEDWRMSRRPLPDDGGAGDGQGNGGVTDNGQPTLRQNRRQPTGILFAVLRLAQPIRIGLGILGALVAFGAAVGVWRGRKWGLVLTALVALSSGLMALVTFIGARLLMRTLSPWLILITQPSWATLTIVALAAIALILALLPPSWRAYAAPRQAEEADNLAEI